MNRLAEVKAGGSGAVANNSMFSEAGGSGSPAPATAAAAAPSSPTANDDNPLEKFYAQVTDLQATIRDIQSMTKELKQKHGEKMQIIDQAKAEEAGAEIAAMTAKLNQLCSGGKAKLDAIAKCTAELKKTPEDEQNNAGVIKIQQNQHAHLLKLFTTAVQEYQTTQKENEKEYKEQTKRRIMTKMREADGTDISEERAEELAEQALELGEENSIFQQAKDTLQQIRETREDILKIERSMTELNRLFQDLALLVNDQQEALDNIIVNVQNSVKYVQKGREQLADAKKYAKKSRKKMCWLLVVVVVIFLFVLAVILGATVKF